MTLKSLFCGFCIMAFSVVGQADFYQVEHVLAKASGENAQVAKTQAVEEAQVQAFSRLIRRLTGKENTTLPETPEIVSMVQDMSIQDEKNTKTEYWATLTIGFQPKRVQEYLKTKGWTYVQKEPPKLLVIPVHQKAEIILSGLEEENPLFQFLRHQELLSDFYPLVLPNGDLDEIVLVNQNLKNMRSSWGGLADRYNAAGIMLLQAEEVSADHWQLSATILVDENVVQQGKAFDWYQGYSLSQAWDVLMQQMEQDWRRHQESPDEKVYYARLTEPSLQAWVQDKKKLEQLKFLKNILVQGVSHDQILISYIYQGQGDITQDWLKAGWVWREDLMGPSGSLKRKEVFYE